MKDGGRPAIAGVGDEWCYADVIRLGLLHETADHPYLVMRQRAAGDDREVLVIDYFQPNVLPSTVSVI